MNSTWASLGGYGNVDARAPLPVGRAGGNGGALGLIMQALMRSAAMKAQPQTPEEDDPELARLLAEAFGMTPQAPSAGIRGY